MAVPLLPLLVGGVTSIFGSLSKSRQAKAAARAAEAAAKKAAAEAQARQAAAIAQLEAQKAKGKQTMILAVGAGVVGLGLLMKGK